MDFDHRAIKTESSEVGEPVPPVAAALSVLPDMPQLQGQTEGSEMPVCPADVEEVVVDDYDKEVHIR